MWLTRRNDVWLLLDYTSFRAQTGDPIICSLMHSFMYLLYKLLYLCGWWCWSLSQQLQTESQRNTPNRLEVRHGHHNKNCIVLEHPLNDLQTEYDIRKPKQPFLFIFLHFP